MLTAGDDTVRVWSVAAPPPVSLALSEPDPPGGRLGKWFGTPPARHRGSVTALAFAPDGKSVYTGSNDKTVRRWDAATGRQLAQLPAPLRGEVRGLAFGPGGAVYAATEASGLYPEPAPDGDAYLSLVHRWDPAGGRAARFLKGQNAGIAFMELSADGRKVLLMRGQTEVNYGTNPNSSYLRYESSGKPVPLVSVWDTATGEQLWASPPADAYQAPLRPRFSPDGQTVLYRTDRSDELALFDARTGARVRTLATPKLRRRGDYPPGCPGLAVGPGPVQPGRAGGGRPGEQRAGRLVLGRGHGGAARWLPVPGRDDRVGGPDGIRAGTRGGWPSRPAGRSCSSTWPPGPGRTFSAGTRRP